MHSVCSIDVSRHLSTGSHARLMSTHAQKIHEMILITTAGGCRAVDEIAAIRIQKWALKTSEGCHVVPFVTAVMAHSMSNPCLKN